MPSNLSAKEESGVMDDYDVLTTKEVAEMLRMHPRTVIRLAKSGELPSGRVGQKFRFRRLDIAALIKSKNEHESIK